MPLPAFLGALGTALGGATGAMSLGATVLGSLYNNKLQNDAINARNHENQLASLRAQEAAEAERSRQRSMEADQLAAVAEALTKADPGKMREQVEQEVADPNNKIVAAANEFAAPELMGQTGNGDVGQQIGTIIAERMAKTRGLLKNAAILNAQSNHFSGMDMGIDRMRGDILNIGSARRASQAVAGREASINPASVERNANPLGDILLLGGQLGAYTNAQNNFAAGVKK